MLKFVSRVFISTVRVRSWARKAMLSELCRRWNIKLNVEYIENDDSLDKDWSAICKHLANLHRSSVKRPWKQYTQLQIALRKIIYRRRTIIDVTPTVADEEAPRM